MYSCRSFLRVGCSRQHCLPRNIVRYNSHTEPTSTISPDLLKRIETFAQKLHSLVQSNDLGAIRQTYHNLVKEVTKAPLSGRITIRDVMSSDQLKDILGALSRSGKPTHLALAGMILADLRDVFGVEQTPNFHTVIIKNLVERGSLASASRWMVFMGQKPGRLLPTHHQWHLLLRTHAARGEIDELFKCIARMPRSGIMPTPETFDILWHLLESTSAPARHFHSACKAAYKFRLPFSKRIQERLYNHFAKLGDLKTASKLRKEYKEIYEMDSSSISPPSAVALPELVERERAEGMKAAIKRFLHLPQYAGTPRTLGMAALLENSISIRTLRLLEERLKIRAKSMHWAILVRNTIRAGDVMAAYSMLKTAHDSGILLDSPMAHPVISALCQTAVKQPSEGEIDLALEIYKMMPRPNSSMNGSDPEHQVGPDMAIYRALLRALSSSPNVAKYYPIALELVQTMESCDIAMDQPMVIASLMSIAMRHSGSYEEALHAYENIYKNAKARLDEKGFIFVLNVFCELSFGPKYTVPPLTLYLKLLQDMRSAGHGASHHVYTVLWRRLSYLATQRLEDDVFRDELISTIRASHDHLTLDASMTPNTAVWNQLMDTYQRAGAFHQAYRVWDMLYISGKFDDVSVTTILDACGYAGIGDLADIIWCQLQADNYPVTEKNWLTWLECLCRLRRLDDAVRTFCRDMKRFDGAAVTVRAIRFLLNFAEQQGQQKKVRALIRHSLPDVWKNLPKELRMNVTI